MVKANQEIKQLSDEIQAKKLELLEEEEVIELFLSNFRRGIYELAVL
jgi:hypothetical protein